jgi:hypothetical protein
MINTWSGAGPGEPGEGPFQECTVPWLFPYPGGPAYFIFNSLSPFIPNRYFFTNFTLRIDNFSLLTKVADAVTGNILFIRILPFHTDHSYAKCAMGDPFPFQGF